MKQFVIFVKTIAIQVILDSVRCIYNLNLGNLLIISKK